MSFFTEVPENIALKNQAKVLHDPFIFKNYIGEREDADLYFVSEKILSQKELTQFRNWMKSIFADVKYCVYSSLIINPNKKDLEKDLVNFYTRNRAKLENIIPKGKKIIALGRSLYSLTQSDDLMTHYFYDNVTKNYKFYHPDFKSYVWPIDSLYKWGSQDCFESYFAFKQVERAINTKIQKRRIREPRKIFIDRPNEFLRQHMEPKKVSWDIETSGFKFYEDKIGCITMSFDGVEGYYLPFDRVDLELFNKFLENKFQILANGKFDCKFLRFKGVKNARVDFDTLHAGHLLNEMRSNSLKTHAWIYTDFGGYDRKLEVYKKNHNIINYLDISHEIMFDYATMDAIEDFRVYQQMEKEIQQVDQEYPMTNGWSLTRYLYEVNIPAIEVFIDTEMHGMIIDVNQLQLSSDKLFHDIQDAKLELYSKLGLSKDFNIDSDPQLGKHLEKLGWADLGRAKAGHYLTGVDKLEKWVKLGYEDANVIIKYRELRTLMNTFIGMKEDKSGYWQYLVYHPEDDTYRVHSTFAVMLADSGRNKSRNPNLQNVPSHGWKAEFVRKYFILPSSDYAFLSVDYSGYQLRASTIMSDDEVMRNAFINLGGDLHSATAQSVLMNNKVTLDYFLKHKKEEPYSTMRFKAKSFNFGLIFNATAITIMVNNIEPNWTKLECEEYIKENDLDILDFKDEPNVYFTVANDVRNKFFETYSGLEKYLEDTKDLAQKQGFIRSIYGVFRRLPQLIYKGYNVDKKRLSSLLNISLNSPIQNMEIVSVMMLMINIHKWLKENNMKSYFIGQIHDAVELVVHKDELNAVCQKIKEVAETDYPELKGIPLEVEGNVADYFGKGELWDHGHDWGKYLAV